MDYSTSSQHPWTWHDIATKKASVHQSRAHSHVNGSKMISESDRRNAIGHHSRTGCVERLERWSRGKCEKVGCAVFDVVVNESTTNTSQLRSVITALPQKSLISYCVCIRWYSNLEYDTADTLQVRGATTVD